MLLSTECEPILQFVKEQRELIEIEREEEETQLRELLRDTRIRELTQFGLCLSKLRIKSTKMGAFDKPVIVFRPNGVNPSKMSEETGDTETLARLKFTNNQKFSRGDLVNLYSMDKSKEYFSDKPLAVGSLEKLEDYKLTVVFGDSVSGEIDFFSEEAQDGLYCLVQAVNDVTYRRFGECLNRLNYYINHPDCPHYDLIRSLFDLHPAVDLKKDESQLIKVQTFYDQSLNKYQQLAVERALNADFYSLIHGPPGTGKTKTVCEVIQQFCSRKKKILVTAASNIAVDNIIERLEVLKTGFRIIRVGNPTRTLESSHKYSLDFLKSTAAKTSPELKKIKQELKKLTQDLTKLTGKSKGINEQRRDIRNQMRGLGNEMYHRKQQISYEILKEADVIVSTQTSSYDDTIERLMMNNPSGKDIDDRNLNRRYMQRSFFDVVILDEAAQSLEVSSWMPILLGTKAIFAGDHKQLPPTVKSKTAERKGFGRTLFEKLAEICDHKYPDLITLLKTQYRMNSSIMQISSSYIYADELIADDSVKERSLKDLPRVNGQSPSEEMNSVLEDELNALIWVDTAGKCIGDRQEDQGKAEDGSIIPLPAVLQTASKYNPGEVEIVVSIYKDLRENQRLDIDDIGIIAPYKAQVDLIRNALTVYEEGKPRSEVSTVDGFQGREKEVIVLSLTRSNPEREVGFLADIRRLNVAITRPKRLLIIVGDSQTVKSDPFINEIYSKVQLHGKVMGIYDFLSILKSNGEDDSKIRAHFNSGTHQTNALYKVKEKSTQPQEGEAGGEPKSAGAKKQKKPKKDQPKDQEAKPSEPEAKPEPEAQPKNNHYGISFDLYARIEVLLKWKEDSQEECPAAIKIYGKLEDQERQGLEVFQREHSELVDVKIVTKPKHSLTISRIKKNPKPQTDDGGEDEQSAEEQEGMTESKPDPDEEKRRKNAEKRARQKEAKRKQKEEEDKLAKLTEEEFLAKLLKEKEEKIESMKFCQATIGNTGNKCLKNVLLLGIVCKFCEVKFCATHAFASMHGCDDAEEDYYEQQRKEQLKALKKGGFSNSKNDSTSEMLQERLRKMKMEAEEKRKPKTKEEEAKGKGGRGGRGGRGGKK